MNYYKTTLFLLIVFTFVQCTAKNRVFTEEDLVKIYTYHELNSMLESQKIIQEYNLNDEQVKEQYYEYLYKLATDEQRYSHFLDKVDQYKKNLTAQTYKTPKFDDY